MLHLYRVTFILYYPFTFSLFICHLHDYFSLHHYLITESIVWHWLKNDSFHKKNICGGEQNVYINVEIIYLRSMKLYVSFSMIFINSNTSYIGLFIKHFNVWYTSKTYGASMIECSRSKILWIQPIHLPFFSETAVPKAHHNTNSPLSRGRWYLRHLLSLA